MVYKSGSDMEDAFVASAGNFLQNKKKLVGIVILVILFLLMGPFYTVEQGDRAVVLRFGELDTVTDPGLHIKIPFVDEVKHISVRTQKYQGKQAIYSKDIQGADVTFSINYSLNAAAVADVFSKFNTDYEGRVLVPQVFAKLKDTFGQFNAVDTVQNRQALAQRILNELQDQLTSTGILVESVQIENIDFSDEYERSVEERMKAEVEVARVRQNLEREKINADMIRTKAQGEADARVATAKAEAEQIRLTGLAEAEAIKAKSQALAQNPHYIQLIEAERWNGVLPQTMLPSSTVPIIGTTPR